MAGVAITLVGSQQSGGTGANTIKATTPASVTDVTLTDYAVLVQGVTDLATGSALPDRVIPFSSILEIVAL